MDNDVSTNKNISDTKDEKNRTTKDGNEGRKKSRFYDQRIIGYKNYGVKNLQITFFNTL